MECWSREKPQIVQLYEVRKSFGGQTIWQMTLTNIATGKHTDKPAACLEGGRHSGEITASESVLWLAWHLVKNYGKDAQITRLLDTKAIYPRPNNNPDGTDMYKLTANTNRSSVRPQDIDGDGSCDEDPTEDLDGDGHSRQMRKFTGAGKGTHVVDTMDAQGRLMRLRHALLSPPRGRVLPWRVRNACTHDACASAGRVGGVRTVRCCTLARWLAATASPSTKRRREHLRSKKNFESVVIVRLPRTNSPISDSSPFINGAATCLWCRADSPMCACSTAVEAIRTA